MGGGSAEGRAASHTRTHREAFEAVAAQVGAPVRALHRIAAADHVADERPVGAKLVHDRAQQHVLLARPRQRGRGRHAAGSQQARHAAARGHCGRVRGAVGVDPGQRRAALQAPLLSGLAPGQQAVGGGLAAAQAVAVRQAPPQAVVLILVVDQPSYGVWFGLSRERSVVIFVILARGGRARVLQFRTPCTKHAATDAQETF